MGRFDRLVIDAELPIILFSPAKYRLIHQHGTRVILTGKDACCRGNAGHLCGLVFHLIVFIVVCAEIPFIEPPPAPHRPVCQRRARVNISGAHARGGVDTGHPHGHVGRSLLIVVVAELAVRVLSPAPDRPILQHRARVIVSSVNVDCRVDAGHLHGHVGRSLLIIVLAELAVLVITPAPHRPVRQQRARVFRSSGDARGRVDTRHLHGHVGRSLLIIVLAEHAVLVTSPAPHRPVRQHRARVILSSAHARGGVDAGHPHGHVGRSLLIVVVAELAVLVITPAPHSPVLQHRARVIFSGRDAQGVVDARHLHGHIVCGRWLVVSTRLAVRVTSPAPNCPVRQHCARVVISKGGASHRVDAGHPHGHVGNITIVVLAEHAVLVTSPAPNCPVRQDRTCVSSGRAYGLRLGTPCEAADENSERTDADND